MYSALCRAGVMCTPEDLGLSPDQKNEQHHGESHRPSKTEQDPHNEADGSSMPDDLPICSENGRVFKRGDRLIVCPPQNKSSLPESDKKELLPFEQVVENLDADGSNVLPGLDRFCDHTKEAHMVALKKYERICVKMQWDAKRSDPGYFTPDKIRIVGGVLKKSSECSQSAHTYLANLKGHFTRYAPLNHESELAYKRVFAALIKSVVTTQELPLSISIWKKFDTVKDENIPRIGVSRDTFLGFVACCWFLLARPSETKNMKMEIKNVNGDNHARFSLEKSKVDQKKKGWHASFRCCCAAIQNSGISRTICPTHSISVRDWNALRGVNENKIRPIFMNLLEAAGVENKKVQAGSRQRHEYNLYSIRIGGLRAALQGGLNRYTAQKLGRWKNMNTELHYESNDIVDAQETIAIKWPLVEALVVG